MAKRMDLLIEMERLSYARRTAALDPTVKIYPTAQIRNFSSDPKAITVGAYTHIECQLMVFGDSGRINIGEWCHITSGTRIWSQDLISIGNCVGIAHWVDIHDADYPPVGWEERHRDTLQPPILRKYGVPTKTVSKPIIIEDDVWVGFKSTIHKGVRIGKGAIVAAGSVIVEDVPPLTLVAGNPAKVVRELKR
jgi:acetyltransferase-like isoleucine patch superfamily enzyme